MKFPVLNLLLILGLAACARTVAPLPNAHAHNDYEHERPLRGALENGFISVEADVHLIDGRLYVSHDRPKDLSKTRTLEDLYLAPLLRHVLKNKGKVYPGYDGFFYLMIDVKTPAEPSYPVLREVLAGYEEMISVVKDAGNDQPQKPVKVFISGNRPVEQLLNDPVKYAGLDGRPEDLGKDMPVAVMPVVSQNYWKYMSWGGEGQPEAGELLRLQQLVRAAHDEGKKVRLWAAPDRPEGWRLLLENGVDWINTDKIAELKEFLRPGSPR